MINLDDFEKWVVQKVSKNKSTIASYEIKNEWRNRETKPGIVVLFATTDSWFGEISFWNSGEADVYILDNLANIKFPLSYITVKSLEEFEVAFQDFFNKLTIRD